MFNSRFNIELYFKVSDKPQKVGNLFNSNFTYHDDVYCFQLSRKVFDISSVIQNTHQRPHNIGIVIIFPSFAHSYHLPSRRPPTHFSRFHIDFSCFFARRFMWHIMIDKNIYKAPNYLNVYSL